MPVKFEPHPHLYAVTDIHDAILYVATTRDMVEDWCAQQNNAGKGLMNITRYNASAYGAATYTPPRPGQPIVPEGPEPPLGDRPPSLLEMVAPRFFTPKGGRRGYEMKNPQNPITNESHE